MDAQPNVQGARVFVHLWLIDNQQSRAHLLRQSRTRFVSMPCEVYPADFAKVVQRMLYPSFPLPEDQPLSFYVFVSHSLRSVPSADWRSRAIQASQCADGFRSYLPIIHPGTRDALQWPQQSHHLRVRSLLLLWTITYSTHDENPSVL